MSDDIADLVSHAPEGNTTFSEVHQAALVEASQMLTPHRQPIAEPSIERPTREYLEENCLKSDLQKRCRELGITYIWTTKSQLIEMILEKSGWGSNDILPCPGAGDAT